MSDQQIAEDVCPVTKAFKHRVAKAAPSAVTPSLERQQWIEHAAEALRTKFAGAGCRPRENPGLDRMAEITVALLAPLAIQVGIALGMLFYFRILG
jgi:hypothetical protein